MINWPDHSSLTALVFPYQLRSLAFFIPHLFGALSGDAGGEKHL